VPITRAFTCGSGLAVRIPAELAYADLGQDLQISRVGDVITIFPARSSVRGRLTEAVAILRRLPNPPEIVQREPIELPDRV
jgi:antitoxin VapB